MSKFHYIYTVTPKGGVLKDSTTYQRWGDIPLIKRQTVGKLCTIRRTRIYHDDPPSIAETCGIDEETNK